MQPTCLMHLSDGSIRNGLVDQPEHDAAIRLNLLVFEYLGISAPGLLRNHFLYDTISGSQGDRDGLAQAYRNGLIRPIVFSENYAESVSGEKENHSDALMRVADTIRDHPSPVGLSDPARSAQVDLLKDHAHQVCDAGAQCKRVQIVKAHYRPFLLEAIKRELSTRPRDASLARFACKIEGAATSEFRVIDAYGIAEEMAREGATDCCRLKSLAFIAMDWLTYPKAVPQLTVPRKATRFTDLCTRAWSRGLAEPKQADGVQELAQIDIPPDAIARLTLGEVIEARNTDLIKEIQKSVASFRKQPRAELGRPEADKWNELAYGFRKWLAQETQIGRKGYLEAWRRSQKNRKKLRFSRITSAGEPIGILVAAGVAFGVTSILKRVPCDWLNPERVGRVAGAATWLVETIPTLLGVATNRR